MIFLIGLVPAPVTEILTGLAAVRMLDTQAWH